MSKNQKGEHIYVQIYSVRGFSWHGELSGTG